MSSKRSCIQAVTISRGAVHPGRSAPRRERSSPGQRARALSAWRPSLSAHRVQLAVGELERFVGVKAPAGLTGLAVERGCHALATARQLEVAVVGEDDGLGSTASADDDGFGVHARTCTRPAFIDRGAGLRHRGVGASSVGLGGVAEVDFVDPDGVLVLVEEKPDTSAGGDLVLPALHRAALQHR